MLLLQYLWTFNHKLYIYRPNYLIICLFDGIDYDKYSLGQTDYAQEPLLTAVLLLSKWFLQLISSTYWRGGLLC